MIGKYIKELKFKVLMIMLILIHYIQLEMRLHQVGIDGLVLQLIDIDILNYKEMHLTLNNAIWQNYKFGDLFIIQILIKI